MTCKKQPYYKQTCDVGSHHTSKIILQMKHLVLITIFSLTGLYSFSQTDSLLESRQNHVSNSANQKQLDKYINLNQIGFYPESQKMAIVNGSTAKTFTIIRMKDNKDVFTDTLSQPQYWKYSDETVRRATFTNLKDTGLYKLYIADIGYSFPFRIEKNVLSKLAESSIKAFYYQRCDAELTSDYAGIWARKMGQPDTGVLVHSSAASAKVPAGTNINSLRGWYDAGDYNKYIVK